MTRLLLAAATALTLAAPVAPASAGRCDDLGLTSGAPQRVCEKVTSPPFVGCRRLPPDDRLICV